MISAPLWLIIQNWLTSRWLALTLEELDQIFSVHTNSETREISVEDSSMESQSIGIGA